MTCSLLRYAGGGGGVAIAELGTRIADCGEKLAADGGEQIQCGWLKDKFGMPWQIVSVKVWDWLRGDDPARVQRVTGALWQAETFDLAEVERAAKRELTGVPQALSRLMVTSTASQPRRV